MMPNKTIYVADADMPIFEKAQELAGDNLSSTIVQALQRYVEAHEHQQAGFHEITLRVGSDPAYTLKRFTGRLLARGQYQNADRRWQDIFQVFKSLKGKLVIYRGNVPSWWGGWNWNFSAHHQDQMEHQRNKLRNWQRKWERQQQRWNNDWPFPPNMPNMGWENIGMDKGDFQLDVYDTLEAIKAGIPEDLYERVKRQLDGDEIEILDI